MESWLEDDLDDVSRELLMSPVQEAQLTFRRRKSSSTPNLLPSLPGLSSPTSRHRAALGSTSDGRSPTLSTVDEHCSRSSLGSTAVTESEAVESLAGVAVRVLVRCRPLLDVNKARSVATAESTSPSQQTVTLTVPSSSAALVRAASQSPSQRSRSTEPGSPSRRLSHRGSIGIDGGVSRGYLCNSFCSEDSSQEEVFEHAAPIVDRVMEGYNGTIFCYGITGSGKTFTMSGPPEEKGAVRDADQQGIVQRSAWRIFEFISQRSTQGEIFAVEVSFLEVYSSDGYRETLVDLLAEDKSAEKPEIKQDPLCPQSFICEGLRRVPINSPDAMCEALNTGRNRCVFMETSRNCLSSRSHCLFIVTVECLIERENGAPPLVKRGKLVLVDLAGSESLKKVMASNCDNEDLRRKQAIGINRVLSHLGSVVNNLNMGFTNSTGYRNSALTMLLRDCLGGSARALLVANIGPEAEWSSETLTTLTFAEKMMQIRNVEKAVVVENEKSVLVQMRQRHEECIRRLQEEPVRSDSTPKEREERSGLQKELDELNERLLTKSKATDTLNQLHEEHRRKMDGMRAEMTSHMTAQFNDIQGSLVQDIQGLQEAIESKAREEGEIAEKKLLERHEAAVTTVQSELSSTVEARRLAESDVSQLRLQLAAAEERAHTLQELQLESVRDHESLETERREGASKASEQLGRLIELEGELQRHRSEASVLQAEAERLSSARTLASETFRVDKENWLTQEAKMLETVQQKKLEVEEQRSLREERARTAEQEHQSSIDGLTAQTSKMEADTSSRRIEYEEVRTEQAQLETEVRAGRDLEATLRQSFEQEVHDYEDKIDAVNQNIGEILTMLHQVQNSIMHATK